MLNELRPASWLVVQPAPRAHIAELQTWGGVKADIGFEAVIPMLGRQLDDFVKRGDDGLDVYGTESDSDEWTTRRSGSDNVEENYTKATADGELDGGIHEAAACRQPEGADVALK